MTLFGSLERQGAQSEKQSEKHEKTKQSNKLQRFD